MIAEPASAAHFLLPRLYPLSHATPSSSVRFSLSLLSLGVWRVDVFCPFVCAPACVVIMFCHRFNKLPSASACGVWCVPHCLTRLPLALCCSAAHVFEGEVVFGQQISGCSERQTQRQVTGAGNHPQVLCASAQSHSRTARRTGAHSHSPSPSPVLSPALIWSGLCRAGVCRCVQELPTPLPSNTPVTAESLEQLAQSMTQNITRCMSVPCAATGCDVLCCAACCQSLCFWLRTPSLMQSSPHPSASHNTSQPCAAHCARFCRAQAPHDRRRYASHTSPHQCS
jgi:hypothetical protein